MDTITIPDRPEKHAEILHATQEMGFSMASDLQTGSFLRALVTSRPNGEILELGTGTGLSLSWIAAGKDAHTTVTTIDNDAARLQVAQQYLGDDSAITFVCMDGNEWLRDHKDRTFDLIFADAWPGKYSMLEETLEMVKPGGCYLVDDMMPQHNWPPEHGIKAENLLRELEGRADFHITKLNWSTGLVLAVRKSLKQ